MARFISNTAQIRVEGVKPSSPTANYIKEYYRSKDGVNISKFAQGSTGTERRIDGVNIEYSATNPVAPTTTSHVEEGDIVVVTSTGTSAGAKQREYRYDGTAWQKTFDVLDNLWSKNTTGASVNLNQKSDGTVRTAGTEVVVRDNGFVGIGTLSPLSPVEIGTSSGGIQFNNTGTITRYRDVYRYGTGALTVTGTLAIVMPNTWTNTINRTYKK